MSKNHTRICTKCRRVFSIESSDLETCAPCSESISIHSKCSTNCVCRICFERFYSPNHLKRCPCCSTKPYTQATKRKYNKKITDKPKKSPKKIPLDILNQMAEKKRVYDEIHAKNFVRWGGVRDRI